MKNPNTSTPPLRQLGLTVRRMQTLVSSRVMWCALATLVGSTSVAQVNTATSVLEPWQPGQLLNQVTQSDPHNDVRKLLRQAKFAQALTLIDKGLLKNPHDPQMRFWQGYIFERMGNPNMAMPVYLALTQEYPELAEPHNNLGVLYAAQGDYEKARAAFEAALRSNPNYATAHENLGDVLMASARQSFLRAQQLGNKSVALTQKIESLKPTMQGIENKP
jgi:Flp pilus assembly protein TadD